MEWRCSLCGHEWTVRTPRAKPPRASLRCVHGVPVVARNSGSSVLYPFRVC